MSVMVAHRHMLDRPLPSSGARWHRDSRGMEASGFDAHEGERSGYRPEDRGGNSKSLWRQISLILSIAATALSAVQSPRQARFWPEEPLTISNPAPVERSALAPRDNSRRLSRATPPQHARAFQTWKTSHLDVSSSRQSARLRFAERD